ncbi:type II secretion system F family protein [Acetobacter sacchari]|uniref:Type II secretion system F family protein n=1 Tax=Acetobacter sacchari TaxID=2661687 RepID=A0ABS3LY64_9PROT|nr:type II secretion system F family protein [Acetobacter sacchari]MBO1360849.1 type II secretion system F family protein [Acetobacter sacchari]
MISRNLKVGVSLIKSIEIVSREASSPTKELFREVVASTVVGRDLGDSLREVARNINVQEYIFFSTVIGIQISTGGGLAEMLEIFGASIKKRIFARKKALALASEARASCYVLGGMPPVMAIVMYLMNPDYMRVLYETDLGKRLMYVAFSSFFLGIGSMVVISKRVLR